MSLSIVIPLTKTDYSAIWFCWRRRRSVSPRLSNSSAVPVNATQPPTPGKPNVSPAILQRLRGNPRGPARHRLHRDRHLGKLLELPDRVGIKAAVLRVGPRPALQLPMQGPADEVEHQPVKGVHFSEPEREIQPAMRILFVGRRDANVPFHRGPTPPSCCHRPELGMLEDSFIAVPMV